MQPIGFSRVQVVNYLQARTNDFSFFTTPNTIPLEAIDVVYVKPVRNN
jgi:hypothetical protein